MNRRLNDSGAHKNKRKQREKVVSPAFVVNEVAWASHISCGSRTDEQPDTMSLQLLCERKCGLCKPLPQAINFRIWALHVRLSDDSKLSKSPSFEGSQRLDPSRHRGQQPMLAPSSVNSHNWRYIKVSRYNVTKAGKRLFERLHVRSESSKFELGAASPSALCQECDDSVVEALKRPPKASEWLLPSATCQRPETKRPGSFRNSRRETILVT